MFSLLCPAAVAAPGSLHRPLMLRLLSAVLEAVRLVFRLLRRPQMIRPLSAVLGAVRLVLRLLHCPRRILPGHLRPRSSPSGYLGTYLSAGSGSGYRHTRSRISRRLLRLLRHRRLGGEQCGGPEPVLPYRVL